MGLLARLRTNSRQASSLSCTSVVSWTYRPDTLSRACYTCMNTLLDPETAGVMKCIRSRKLRHLLSEVVRASQGMSSRAAATLSCCVGGMRSRCAIVSRSYLRTVFWVDHASYHCPSFFREMGSFLFVYSSSLWRKTRSIWWKRCRSICHLSLGPPWTTKIKSSR